MPKPKLMPKLMIEPSTWLENGIQLESISGLPPIQICRIPTKSLR